MKHFTKFFLATCIIFTVVFTPALALIEKASEITIFSPPETILQEELAVLYDEKSPFFEAFTNSKRVNVLVMGVNTNLTDTLMLVSYDMNAQQIDLISIPRDTFYERNSSDAPSYKKINAAHHDGVLGSAHAVSDLLMGIPINYYVLIDYDGVRNIVDAIGGVPMDIPFRMYYTDPYDKPPLKIDLQKGEQILDGDQAMQFLRFRKGNKGYAGYTEGDIGRIEAHQEFIKSAFKQCLSNLPAAIDSVLKNVESDLTLGKALNIATNATGLNSDSLHTYTIPGEARNGEGGLSFFFSDEEGIKEMLTQIYSVEPETTDDENSENPNETPTE